MAYDQVFSGVKSLKGVLEALLSSLCLQPVY